VWVAEQRVGHQELVVVALNLLVAVVALVVVTGLRSKAVTQQCMLALVAVVSLAGVGVQT